MKKLYVFLLSLIAVSWALPVFSQQITISPEPEFLSARSGITIKNRTDGMIDLRITDGDKTLYMRDIQTQNRVDSKYMKALTGVHKTSGKNIILLMIPDDEAVRYTLFTKDRGAESFSPYYVDNHLFSQSEKFNARAFLMEFFENFTIDIDFPGGNGKKLAAHIQAQSIKAFKPFSAVLNQALGIRIAGIHAEPDIPEHITFPVFKVKGVVLDWTGEVLRSMTRPLYRAGYEDTLEVGLNLVPNMNARQGKGFVLTIRLELPRDDLRETETYIYKFRNTEYEYSQIVSALEQAWFLKGYAVTAQVHFHQPTRLFMITGTPAELDTARQILEQLDFDAEAEDDDQEADEDDDTEELLRQVREQNTKLSEQYSKLIQAVSQLKNAVDALYVK